MDTWAVWYGSMGIAFEKAQTTNAGWSIEKETVYGRFTQG